ncbi:hypothetical protein BCR32DRAFT_293146 [Anaeromyces robustus]|uniref:Uncharacterized protein n=1 Tax=Anaeromyces robustus TaxID=1754192 RepID=A0A1Y1X7F9_9FUNG|nr:hypothetical protein BCR32DRAFT_293146 [Anaeromyces robustus]|eukprot:ORX81697.1 hypothetical protein BCR32DRAFT_293146 [Anaeromyces robustus]
MEDFDNNQINIEELITQGLNDKDDFISTNKNNSEDENSMYTCVKLEPSELEECPPTYNYLKVECSFSKHYNSIGQNVKAYVTILNDCFEELNNIKCIISSSENYFNTYSFIINSIQINEVIIKEVNLTIYDKYLNTDNYDLSFENGILIENLIDNLPNNISIKLINENQSSILPSYPSIFNITSDFFIKDLLKINETNEIFNVMILGSSLDTSKNFTNSLKLLFENYSSNKIDFSNDNTIKNSFIEKYLDNDQWPLNIRIFYNTNYNHLNQKQKEDKNLLKYILNGYFPNDNSIVHLTGKKPLDYNKIWNEIETYQLEECIENMESYYLYNKALPKNNKQYINALIILLPVIANTNLEILNIYKELADYVAKQGRPVYIVLDNYINNSISDSSLTDVNDSKNEINFINIINEFSLYPIFTTSSYELITLNDNDAYDYNPNMIQRFKKNMNKDILLLHMVNRIIKDLIEINRSQKMLINPETENTDIIIMLYWNNEYDQNLNLIPTVIGECYSKYNSNRMALISNINQKLNISFKDKRLDYFKELASFDIESMEYENIDFKEILNTMENLLKESNNNNNWNIWIITNTEISNTDINIIESKLIKKQNDKIFYVNIRDKQDIGDYHNDNLEMAASHSNHFLNVENIDSLIEYFCKNTKKNNNLVINPKLTLNMIKQYSTNDEINVNYSCENIGPLLLKYDFKIPSSISLIHNISKMTLSNCKLRGTIPDALKYLTNLNEL